MDFEWDDEKAIANEQKHGVSFETAMRVFLDPNRREDYDWNHDEDEERWVAIGLVESRLLMVVYAERNKAIRIISARKATKNEQKAYRALQP